MDVDDTLVLILERIDSPVSVIRAAATCRRWRRLIADAGFLRRYRSLHGPPVAGDYYNGDHRDGEDGRISEARHDPWYVPSSSIDTRHFSLDFVLGLSIFPHRGSRWDKSPSWMVRDSRGSLLLMECNYDMSRDFLDLVVYEPVTQRYKIIPPPSDFAHTNYDLFRGPYLVDGDEDVDGGRIGMSNFKVLCVFLYWRSNNDAAHTTMFTVSGDKDATWSEKAIDHIASRLHSRFIISNCLGHILGSYYFVPQPDGTLITLDRSTGKFSSSVLPQTIIKNYWNGRRWMADFSVIDGGDGEPRIVVVMDHTMEVFVRVNGEWGLENKVLLSKVICDLPGYQPSFFNRPLDIVKRGVGFVVILLRQERHRWPFSVDLKTMEVAPATKRRSERTAYQCEFPWPPVLHVCLGR